MPGRFELAPWRKPLLADDGPFVGVGGVLLILALAFGFLASSMWRWSDVVAWGTSVAGLAVAGGLLYRFGHPAHGAGSIVFEDGRLTLDAGRGAPRTIPIRAIRSAWLHQHAQQPERDELVLEIEGERWVATRVRLCRLAAPERLLLELRAQIAVHGDLGAFDRASSAQIRQRQVAFLVCAAIALLIAAWGVFAG